MKKRFLRYAGDKAVGALLERYACPTSFHVVRTRFLGNIATPKLDASPLRTIESFWEGELPEFDNDSAANELFESLTGLWNELAKHQSGTKPIRLTRMAAKPDSDDIRRLCRTRTEELEGFIEGLFGDAEIIDLPERANEALDNLGQINAMIRGIVDLLERESAPPASEKGPDGNSQERRGTLTHRGEGTACPDACLPLNPPTNPFHYGRGQAHRPLSPDFHFSFGSANHRVASDAFINAGLKALKALRRSTPNG